ncbi:outer membrane beta-barrel protein [Campylobacter troglodytis]|uniref:outer membrane beta-barrel protein n=1 Tax=Campylobacter troglodytis TaxID=654363 RepID=UPI0011576458|nr:outer membrane beta-barrel protein [Campylobacter troglodytis]TQR58139.1 hypothetical protein DMC01_08125 [Campylobacter troglodytis]
MRKIALSLVLAGLVATSVVAEESGVFVGIQSGYGGLNAKANIAEPEVGEEGGSDTLSGFRYGFVAGYKQFFSDTFGLRYYGLVDNGDYEKDGNKVNTINANVNIDALYNFASSSSADLGVFAGLSLGYTHHSDKEDDSITVSGFDVGLNLGLRANIARAHGLELYSRIGFVEQKDEIFNATLKLSQPYQVGLRYTFSF